MRFIKRALPFLFLLPASAGAGGGSLVGNGAGIVEQNVYYAYELLPDAAEGCLALPATCGLDEADAAWLARIRALAQSRAASPDWVHFISEQEHPGHFDTGPGEAHRLARTGAEPGAEVHWNQDLFYLERGRPALDLPALVAIWVHELGHQAGNPDHAYLDSLGARVRLRLATDAQALRYEDESTRLELVAWNQTAATAVPTVVLSDGQDAHSLAAELVGSAACPSPDARRLGWSVVYLRWDARRLSQLDGTSVLPLTAWLRLRCVRGDELVEVAVDVRLWLQLRETPRGQRFAGTVPVLRIP